MSCATCRETFAGLRSVDPTSDCAHWLDQREPQCRCQVVSVSEFSRCPVENEETLVRIIVAPQHLHRRTKEPKATTLTHAQTIGMSVFRENLATDKEILDAAKTLVARARASAARGGRGDEKKVGVLGVLRMTCEQIRTFRWETEPDPCFCVYDTATRLAPAHADAFQRIANVSPEVQDARKNALFAHIKSGFLPVEKFRNGLLAGLAPEITP